MKGNGDAGQQIRRDKGVLDCCPVPHYRKAVLIMARLGAGTRKRADGTLEKRFTVDGVRYSIYGRNTKELIQKEQEIRKNIELGIYTDNRRITLDKYFEEWLSGKRNGTKGNTLKTYKSYYYKHVSPKIGSRKVQQIERREILALQRDMTEHLSVSTCNTVLKMLKVVFNNAIQDAVISKSPADGIKALKDTDTKASETYHRALTEKEQCDFMKELKSDYYYEFAALLLCTGMRSGEAAALTWDDIDYKQNVIHVTKTATFNEDGTTTVGSPKSEAGKRDIPLNDSIKNILLKQRKKQGSIIQIENRVFTAVYGGMVHNHAVNRAISDALVRLEEKGKTIEHFTAHALRDTFATRYIEQGGNPQTLKTILGHTSLAMTMDLYSHVLPNTKQKEMDNLKIVL